MRRECCKIQIFAYANTCFISGNCPYLCINSPAVRAFLRKSFFQNKYFMSIKSLFGSVFFSALAALIIYDLVVKGLVEKVRNQYDDTFDNFEPGTVCVDRFGRKFVAAA